MKRFVILLAYFAFFVAGAQGVVLAQECESLEDFPEKVNCAMSRFGELCEDGVGPCCPENYYPYPNAGDPEHYKYMCTASPDEVCCVSASYACTANGGACETSCHEPLEHAEYSYVCEEGTVCCVPGEFPTCEEVPYNECLTIDEFASCYGGSPETCNYYSSVCTPPDSDDCLRECETAGEVCAAMLCNDDAANCDEGCECSSSGCAYLTPDVDGDYIPRSDLYCATGGCCQKVLEDTHACEPTGVCAASCNSTQVEDAQGTGCSDPTGTCCIPNPSCPGNNCLDECGALDTYPSGCSGLQACCIPNNYCNGICENSCSDGREHDESSDADCPSGTICCEEDSTPQRSCPDDPEGVCTTQACDTLTMGLYVEDSDETCDVGDQRCCVAVSECEPDPPGCQLDGSCPCGWSGCLADEKCTAVGDGSISACIENPSCGIIPCTSDWFLMCGPDAGCPEGYICLREGSNYICMELQPGQNCQNQTENALEPVPYTGPILSFVELIGRSYFMLWAIGVVIGLIAIIKSGYTLMTSQGNPIKVAEAKNDLTAAIIGITFILLAAVLLRLIISPFFGIV